MGINFSRLLSLKYGSAVASYLGTKYQSISVGRVMTCVLGMVVRREREIRSFVKTPFYRVIAGLSLNGRNFEGEWRAVKGSRYFNSPLLYKENGFQKKEDAQKLIEELSMQNPLIPHVLKMERKKENKNSATCFTTLRSLQNDCARFFKISPDETSESCSGALREKAGYLSANRCPCAFFCRCQGNQQKPARPAAVRYLQRPCK